MQIAWVEPETVPPERDSPAMGTWMPSSAIVGVIAPGVRRVVEALRAAFPECDVLPVAERLPDPAAAPQALTLTSPAGPTIQVGDAESWQRQFNQWQRIRLEGEMLILAECPSELRSLAGCRELPPYAETHTGRAWVLRDGGSPQRVIVPGLSRR